jgi:hypothetical protein
MDNALDYRGQLLVFWNDMQTLQRGRYKSGMKPELIWIF